LKIIVFAKNQEFINQVKETVQSFLGFELSCILESDQLPSKISEVITTSEKIALTIIDPAIQPRNVFYILESMNKAQKQVPVIVMTPDEKFFTSELMGEKFNLDSHFHSLNFRWERGDILKIRSKLLEILSSHPMLKTLEIGDTFLDEDFFSIRTVSFFHLKSLSSDIYFKKENDTYIKIISANEPIAEEKVRLLISKDINDLYLLKDERLNFLNHCIQDLTQSFEKGFESIEKQHMANALIYNVTAQQFRFFTPSDELIELNKTMMNSSIEMINPTMDYFSFLKRLSKLNFEYRYNHSLFASYISYAIVQKMKWSSGIAELKLSLAFLLHDITLPTDKLALIQSKDSTEFKKLSPNEQQTYLLHPEKAAELVNNYQGLPLEIESLILDQHENTKGKGFPVGKSTGKIAPLSCVFITAHELIHKLYETDFSQASVIQAIREIQDSLKGRNFENAIKALFEVFSLDY